MSEHFHDTDQARRFRAEKLSKQNLFTSPRMFVDVYCLEPGQAQQVHSHDGNDKVYYVLEGRCAVTIGDERRELGPGELAVAPSGVPHGAANDSEGRVRLLVWMAPCP